MSQVAKVVIRDAAVVTKKMGDYRFEVQTGILQISADEASELEIPVPRDGAPYPPGVYLIGGKSFRTNDYGQMIVSKRGIVLVPEKAAAPASAVR